MKNFFLTAATLLAMLMPTAASAQEAIYQGESGEFKHTYEAKDLLFNITGGWVAKEWRTTINGETRHEDFWGNPDKMLHGMQVGLSVSKGLFHGLGFRAGLYYEWYLHFFNSQMKEDYGFNRFSEHCLYIPLHAMIRMYPFSNKSICVTPFGGIGFNWAIVGKLKSGPMAVTDKYGRNTITGRQYPLEIFDYNNHPPHHWNVQAEAGLAIRIKRAEVAFTYSWGLNHHRLYDEAFSRQNKLNVNLSYVIDRER